MPNTKKKSKNQRLLPIVSLMAVLIISFFGWMQNRTGGNDSTPSFFGMIAAFSGILTGIIFFIKRDFRKSFQTIFFSIPLFVYFYQSFFSNIYLTEIGGTLINNPEPYVSAIFWITLGVLAIFMATKLRIKKLAIAVLTGFSGALVLLFGIYLLLDIVQGPTSLTSEVIYKRSQRFASGGYSLRSYTREYNLYVSNYSFLTKFRVNKMIYDEIDEGNRVEIKYYPRTKQLLSIRKTK